MLIDDASACDPLASGVSASFEITELDTSLARMLPSAATPVAIPIWRKVELIPDAIPARAGSTTPTAVEASGTLTRPQPTPATIIPGSRWVQSSRRRDPAHQHQAGADQQESGGDQELRGHVTGEAPGQAGGEEDRAGQRQQPHAGVDRRGPEHVLEVEHEIGQQREDRGRDRKRRDQSAVEGGNPQQLEVEHRGACARLDEDEHARAESRPRPASRRRWPSPNRRDGCGSARTRARSVRA